MKKNKIKAVQDKKKKKKKKDILSINLEHTKMAKEKSDNKRFTNTMKLLPKWTS